MFSQILSIALVNLRALPERKGASAAAIMGIAGVVAVLVGVLAIAEGFRRTMMASGSPDVAIVTRSGANSELTSGISRDEARLVSDAPGIARDAQGPLVSSELLVIIDLPKRSTHTSANVPLRGVEPHGFDLRDHMRMVQGRRFEPGKNEVIIGAGAAREFEGLEMDRDVKIGQNVWRIVGIFTSGGGLAESEVWCDAAVLQPAYHRPDSFQSVYAKLASPDAFTAFKDALTANPQLKVKVSRLADFYAEQSSVETEFISKIGIFITSMMAIGALFGALNTMYSAVAARTREIATLRALGFGSGPVVLSVLLESLALALAGGIIGSAGAYAAFDGFTASTLNFQTFSQVTFAFAVTPRLLAQAIAWAAVLGLIGGIFPGIRAARLPIATGLRET